MYKISHIILSQPNILYSTEDEYLFANFLYKNMYYNNKCSYIIVQKNETILNINEINELIEKNLPLETNEIKKDIEFEKTFIGKNLIKFGIISDWSFNYFKKTKVKNESRKNEF